MKCWKCNKETVINDESVLCTKCEQYINDLDIIFRTKKEEITDEEFTCHE